MTADVVTAADLEAMTPEQRAETVRAGLVNDPATLPPGIQEFRRQRDAQRAAEGQRAS